jgi:hypothetical protein
MTAETNLQATERIAGKVLDRTGDFVEAAASAATNVFEAASNIVSEAVTKYGQSVVDAVLWVVRIDALQTLVTAWMFVGICVGIMYFITTGFTRRNWSSRIENGGSDGLLYVPIVVAYGVALIIATLQLHTVSNIWLYTGVVKPELYLAKQAVDIVKERLAPKPAPQQPR